MFKDSCALFKKASVVVVLLSLSSTIIVYAQSEPGARRSLFDSQSLDGWVGSSQWWRVDRGAIVGEIAEGEILSENQFLFWEDEIYDFELTLEFRISGNRLANSGVQFRSQEQGDGGAAGYQADIDDGAVWTGRIYDEHGRGLIVERGTTVVIGEQGKRTVIEHRKPESFTADIRRGDWNRYRIRAVGARIRTWINGKLTANLTDNHLGQHDYSGRLALQLHSGPGSAKIEFKDIELIDLGKSLAPKMGSLGGGNRSRADGLSPAGANLGFENGTTKGWTPSGEAWNDMPLQGDTIAKRRPGQTSMHEGKFWIGGYERSKNDAAQGTLTSDPFGVTHPWGSFLVGGGASDSTRVEIEEESTGKIIFSASGEQVESMSTKIVDLSAHQGKKIKIRVVDQSSGPWGHINFDDFRFHKLAPASRVSSNPLLQHLVQNPLPKSEDNQTAQSMWVPDGFRVTQIANQPKITQPIAFTFDSRGRLWLEEAHSYPQRRPDGGGLDRIIILEDGDGDGSFETRKIFAEGLNLVSGLEIGFNGVWVGAAPSLLFIPDKDGDDVPDGEPEVLLDGWGYQDTHETLNSFTWGPDGWLYGNQGVFCKSAIGKPGTPLSGRKPMRAGVWRYHPTEHQFEVFANGGSNQWGIDFSEFGHLFITHCRSSWGGGPTTYMIRNGHYWNQANSYHAPFVASGQAGFHREADHAAPFRNFLPSSAHYGHGEGGAGAQGSRALYGGHSHVGTMIYLGGNWPDEYRDQLFTFNLHGHQLNRQINNRNGSGYETIHAGSDQLLVEDPHFIGVDLKSGPDGAVYFIDWADRQHCHNPDKELWDRTNGGIYRMEWIGTYQPKHVNLPARSTAELVNLVTHRDEWFSRMARRVLQEREDESAIPLLEAAAANSSSTASKLRLIWALHSQGELIPPSLLEDSSEEIRAWAVRCLSQAANVPNDRFISLARNDRSPVVRLEIASSLPGIEREARWEIVEALAGHVADADDRFLPKMIWFGLADLCYDDTDRAMQVAASTSMDALADSIVWFLSKDSKGRSTILNHLRSDASIDPDRALFLMADSLRGSNQLEAPKQFDSVTAHVRNRSNQRYVDQLAGIFGDPKIFARMRATLIDQSLPFSERMAAFEFLKTGEDKECASEFIKLLNEPKFRSQVIPTLGRFDEPQVARVLLAMMPTLPTKERFVAFAALAAQPKLARELLLSIRDGKVDGSPLNALHVRQMHNLADKEVSALLGDVWGQVTESSEIAKANITKYTKLYSEAPLWAHKASSGKEIYDRLCVSCHVMKGEGTAIGPELTGSGKNGSRYFIENIVDPNAVIGEAFQLNIVTKRDGTVLSGMPVNESDESLTLRTVTDAVTVPTAEIKSRNILAQSMMPPGLLETLSKEEVVDLIKYLCGS